MISARYEERIKELRVMPKSLLTNITKERKKNGWLVLSTLNCPKPTVDFEHFGQHQEPDMFEGLGEWYFESIPKIKTDEQTVLAQTWSELIQDPVIPFDLALRKSRLTAAYEELRSYIESH